MLLWWFVMEKNVENPCLYYIFKMCLPQLQSAKEGMENLPLHNFSFLQ